MQALLPFILFPFFIQLFALSEIKNPFFRWSPVMIMEALLMIGMIFHWIDPPSFDILGWQIYLWLMGSVLFGSMLAWGAYVLYYRGKR